MAPRKQLARSLQEDDDPPQQRATGPGKRRDRSVRVGRTPVGKGIFAQKSYQRGALIGEIQGTIIKDPTYGSEYCMNIGDGRILEPDAPFRFVNHCCDPNCEFDWFDVSESDAAVERRVFLIALDRIRPGEELTIDYHWSAGAAIPCRCGAHCCRGWIVAPEQLHLLTRGV